MTEVTIEYCVPCGFRDRALDVQQAILTGLERDIDRFELEMGDHGIFQVRVDGTTVFDKDDDEFDVDAIVRAVRKQL
ncbi:Rdx family protein [Salinibaculum rarum]|jgi:selenoprotein W-related protein|uniref:Rdx family protein n=1 Tax=Salinibaculum rarum TaxID=3058903 RepID=UPI00265F50A0|nr:Rdx family protein [Salinibaculum sp. KK48]